MYERFTDRARKVMQLANQEARRFNHEYIGAEHVLVGLIKEGSGVAAMVLKNLDVDLRKIRLEVEKLVQSGPDMVTMGKLPQTPGAKKVLVYSMEEARNLNHNYVGTEHLLLGLLRVREGVAAQVLTNLGLKLEEVREEIEMLVQSGPDRIGMGKLPQTSRVKRAIESILKVVKLLSSKLPQTPGANKVIEYSMEEARNLNHNYVGTEHLLLGLLREREGVAAQVLTKMGLKLEEVRDEVRKIVRQLGPDRP